MLYLICNACLRAMHDTEGDTRNALGQDFELCESCLHDWDDYGIPNHILATYAG
jgi:hypothetical protein